MMDNIKIELRDVPDVFSELVLRESVFVIRNDIAAESRVETIYPPIQRRLVEPPQVSAHCGSIRTWMFSGRHLTHNNGIVMIKLNKFLECIPTAMEGTIYSNYIGSKPYFSATAEVEEPIFLTCKIDMQNLVPPRQQAFVPQAFDVAVKVMSWNHDGTPAPDVPFNWIAIARIASVTNF